MCDEGILEKIDWNKLGLDRTKFGDAGRMDCGIPYQMSGVVLAYDKEKLPNGPNTVADLFDTKKIAGKRGLVEESLS
ncbi:spermidine/putrescine-binding protein [Bradyrhizobium sp. RT6a]